MKIYLIIFFSLAMGLFVNAQDKLITIYTDNCSLCHKLLDSIYKKSDVKKELSRYKLEILNSNSKKAKEYIEAYNIKEFPTQIVFYDYGMTVFGGHLTTKHELEFLRNPEGFNQTEDSLKIEN